MFPKKGLLSIFKRSSPTRYLLPKPHTRHVTTLNCSPPEFLILTLAVFPGTSTTLHLLHIPRFRSGVSRAVCFSLSLTRLEFMLVAVEMVGAWCAALWRKFIVRNTCSFLRFCFFFFSSVGLFLALFLLISAAGFVIEQWTKSSNELDIIFCPLNITTRKLIFPDRISNKPR